MNKVVAHFIRKNSQLRASFIQNQILNHIEFKPVIISRYYSNKSDGGFAEFNHSEIPHLNLGKAKKFDVNFRYLKKISKKDTKKIIDFLDKHNVSVLHFHYGSDATIYSDVIKYSGRPSVVSFYGYDSSSFKDFLFGYGKKLLNKNVFQYVNNVLAMSPDMKNDLLMIGCPKEKIIVHYYGTDVKNFYQNKVYANNEIINFVIISGLEPQKGHIFLLKSFQLAYQKSHKIRLTIYGTGKIKKKIKDFIIKNNLSSYVSLNGKVSYGSAHHLEILRNADVFIHPSVTAKNGDKEGIPGAIVEAMASGLPIISTYHAGIPYIIENEKTGLLVREWDIEGLARQILRVANDVELRKYLGQNGQKYAIENLDLKTKEKELERIYNKVLMYS